MLSDILYYYYYYDNSLIALCFLKGYAIVDVTKEIVIISHAMYTTYTYLCIIVSPSPYVQL